MPEAVKKKITIVTPCYNEEDNVVPLFEKVAEVMQKIADRYQYDHLFIDNASKDLTLQKLRKLATTHKNCKVICNTRNFGHIRSPYHGILQGDGDCVICLVADFQDPPEMLLEFIKKWEEGYKIVLGIKNQSDESPTMFALRRAYYNLVTKLAEVDLIKNFTGFGLYDALVIKTLKTIDDPYPYFRGLISELGYETYRITYKQPTRKRGITKNNFYTLYDMAMLGITNHSKVPLRLATMTGFALSGVSLFLAIAYLILKLIFWNTFIFGTAPVLIGIFFLGSVQLFFIGILGEYIGSIHTQVLKRPHVIEKERINF